MQNANQSKECIKTNIYTFFNQNQNSHFVQQAMKLKITEHKIGIELDLDEQITNISDKMKAAIDALNKQRFEILDKQEKSRLLSLIKNKFDETEKSLEKIELIIMFKNYARIHRFLNCLDSLCGIHKPNSLKTFTDKPIPFQMIACIIEAFKQFDQDINTQLKTINNETINYKYEIISRLETPNGKLTHSRFTEQVIKYLNSNSSTNTETNSPPAQQYDSKTILEAMNKTISFMKFKYQFIDQLILYWFGFNPDRQKKIKILEFIANEYQKANDDNKKAQLFEDFKKIANMGRHSAEISVECEKQIGICSFRIFTKKLNKIHEKVSESSNNLSH